MFSCKQCNNQIDAENSSEISIKENFKNKPLIWSKLIKKEKKLHELTDLVLIVDK